MFFSSGTCCFISVVPIVRVLPSVSLVHCIPHHLSSSTACPHALIAHVYECHRDPDPMGSIGSSVDASPEESSGGGAAATSTNGGDGGVSVGSSPVGNSPIGRSPVSSVPVGSSPIGSSPIGSHPVGSHVDTPERPSKRQRMSPGAVTPPPTDGISNDDTGVSGSSEVAAPVASPSVTSPPTADADTDTDVDIDEGTGGGAPLSHIAPATASESVAAASAAMPAPAALIPNGAVNGVGAGFTRTPSFSPDAPISHATAAALGAGAPVMRTNEGSPKRSVAAAGGASDVWGGGELTRTLSEGATQVRREKEIHSHELRLMSHV